MKAAIYDCYGAADVLRIVETPRPAPKPGEILVRVHAAAVTTADWRMRASAFPGATWLPGRMMVGLRAPRHPILGAAFSGEVATVAPDVTRFAPGDAVFGFAGRGAHAEYLTMPAAGAVTAKPALLGHDEAAATPFGALSALVFLRDVARVRPGWKVAVVGASGGVGVWAVQIARHLGAEVTGVSSSGNIELVRALGAAHALDYARETLGAGGVRYDLVLDAAGATRFADLRHVLAPKGVFLPLEFGLRDLLRALTGRVLGGRRVMVGVSGDHREDLETVAALIETGAIRPVVAARYPLAAIAEAHRHVESRHACGAVILALAPDERARLAAE